MAFISSTSTPNLVNSFAPRFNAEYQNIGFRPPEININAGKQVDYGNYFGIGDLPGKYQASFENSFRPDEIAINAAINESAIDNLLVQQEAELNSMGLAAYANNQANKEIAKEARSLAREKAQTQMKKSGWGLAATIAGTAASFIPGVGAIAGPAAAAGVGAIGNQVG
jgi:hypothetical protein